MKICRLKLKNLNSFREEVDIDFDGPRLGSASLVAITGPTGAGKTTLLDAMCVALYGKTPRLSGTGNQHQRHLISHGEKEGFAEVRFIANGIGYIASWSIRRGGAAKRQLSYAESGKVISNKLSSQGKALGSSEKTVSQEVKSILGLDFAAFRRSVMLAQGEFAAFLKTNMENRRKILEATAGISIYDVLKGRLKEKVTEVKAANADVLMEIEKIPEAYPVQLTAAEMELDRLKNEAKLLETRIQEIQPEKDREIKRKEAYEKLQSLEERQVELSDQQREIDALHAELENAQRAERLRPEKRTYDAAKADLEKTEKALNTALTEKMDAEKQVKIDKANSEKKAETYLTAAAAHTEKTDVYTDAKLDIGRAANQFAEADNRTLKLADLNDEIETLSDELTNRETKKTQLQKQIDEAQTFLDENPLPSDRRHRLNRVTGLLVERNARQKQLKTAGANEVDYEKKIASLKREIKELSETRGKRLAEKTNAETVLKRATTELNKLLAAGTHEEWITQKQRANEALPIAQKYETVENDLVDAEDRLRKLSKIKADLDAELEQIGIELVNGTEVLQRAEEAVKHWEATRDSAFLSGTAKQLRQRLQAGEPCHVCGAVEHPWANIVEPEGEDVLRAAEDALDHAKTDAQTVEKGMQVLNRKQAATQRDKRNTNQHIEDCDSEIEILRHKKTKRLEEWQEIYPGTDDISSAWAVKQIEKADTAIAALRDAEQACTKASHAYNMIVQQLETCESDVAREEESLSEVQKQLKNVHNAVSDLQTDFASTEERFWEFLPEAFHDVAPEVAVEQFSEKIEEVATHKEKLDTTEANLKVLEVNIETYQKNLENLRRDRDDVQAEIEGYQREGKELLDTIRERTGGLETKDEIDAALGGLKAGLQAKETGRDAAYRQLQESETLFAKKQATHEIYKTQYSECGTKLKTAQMDYFDKLKTAGFDSPEAQDNAFRGEAEIQKLTRHIEAYEDEKRQLALEITELRTRFQETPFDPKVLARIEAETEEIGEQLKTKQQEIGGKQNEIKNLKDALRKREAFRAKIDAARQELERWQRLHEVMPKNELRDFALEIMFKQMGVLANVQLDYLTSERYQLKVESIGDLTVIDRWNANEERPVETLSGGESFLTSLALALALADLSRGRAQLNSLFLDEGFGTLDRETLDVAISALEGLRMQGRSIFLISHVQELTRRIPVKINVRKRGDGSSSVQF